MPVMKADEFANARAWEQLARRAVLGLLFLSSFQFLVTAFAFGSLAKSGTGKLITGGCVLFAGVAFALGLTFRKVGAPTWKHKLAVGIVALPAALTLLTR
jgi:hypothetical protein